MEDIRLSKFKGVISCDAPIFHTEFVSDGATEISLEVSSDRRPSDSSTEPIDVASDGVGESTTFVALESGLQLQ
jgi:hypothetical protein